MSAAVAPTHFQQAVLRFRSHCHIVNAGGRGSGKSFSMVLDLIDHCRDFGADARPLVTRESWSGLQQLSDDILDLARSAFGNAQRNKGEGTITLPNGAVITLSQMADENSYSKHQGKSFSALYADEAGNYPPAAWAFLRRVRSNLRVAPGRRAHIHLTCNPHGRAHTVIYKEFITRAPPWHPFQDDQGEWWVWTTSSLDDNPHIDRESYRRQLLASTGSDRALADAWLAGKWDVLGGVMFDVFDPAVHIIRRPAVTASYRMIIGADWGTAAPATGILLGRLREPLGHLRQGDIIALDETDTADPADLSLGTGASVHTWAEQLREMMARNGRRGVVVVTDDARGLNGDTVVRELVNCQISAHRPHRKDRVGTWTLIRSMLQAAADGSDRPALWITDRCPHLIDTLPEAPRGTLRPEDIDPKWPRDHWLDGLGYGLRELHQHRVGHGRAIGLF